MTGACYVPVVGPNQAPKAKQKAAASEAFVNAVEGILANTKSRVFE